MYVCTCTALHTLSLQGPVSQSQRVTITGFIGLIASFHNEQFAIELRLIAIVCFVTLCETGPRIRISKYQLSIRSTRLVLVTVTVAIRYSQKETPGLFSWEFSCNQLAHNRNRAFLFGCSVLVTVTFFISFHFISFHFFHLITKSNLE